MIKSIVASSLCATAYSLALPSIFGSHQVFQSGAPVQIWGTEDASSSVTVTFQGTKYTSPVNNGAWNVSLPAQPPSTSVTTIQVAAESGSTIVLDDIAFGDVFVCSGQSNMQLSVLATVNQTQTIAQSAQYSQYIRLFQVALDASYVNATSPQTNLTTSIAWSQASPANVAGMSAMCYFYATQLYNGQRYIGVIDSSWGGTAIEVWMSPSALAACGEGESQEEDRRPAQTDLTRSSYGGEHKYIPDPLHPQPLSAVYPSKPSCLYYSMIAPLLPLATKAFLWYQGEANTGNPVGYARCFPSMISQWRQDWVAATHGANDPSSPFLFAQLAAWPNGDNGAIAVQRYAQQAALALCKVGMVVTADFSDPSGSYHPIHPPWKAEVGRRAALWAQNILYGNTSSPLSGPVPLSVTVDPWSASWGAYHYGISGGICEGGTGFTCMGMRIKFDQALLPRALFGPLQGQDNGFSLIGLGGNYSQPVTFTGIRSDDPTVLQLNVTWIGPVPPAVLQLGWHDYPTLPLANAAGLPVGPFNITVPQATTESVTLTRQYPEFYSSIGA